MAAPGGSSLDDILLSAAGGVGVGDGPSLNSDIALLVRAWCNEKAAPEILPYPAELFGGLQTMLKAQEEAVAALPMAGPDAVNPAVAAGYHMDLQRVRFLLAAYLRTRLLKIQRWALHVTSEQELTARLSPQEKSFAREFVSARIGHLQASVLAHLPVAYRALVGHEAGVLDGPDLGTHVAAIPLEDLGELLLGGGDEPMDMPAGQAKILPYAAVRDLVLAGRVRLV